MHPAYSESICCFAYDPVEGIFKHNGTTVTMEADNASSPKHELAEDVFFIIAVFSAHM